MIQYERFDRGGVRAPALRVVTFLVVLGLAAAAPARHAAAAPGPAVQAGGYKVIVHPSNPVAQLRRAEVRELFLKRRANWSPDHPAHPVDLAPTLPARAAFSREVLGLAPSAVTNFWMQEIFAGRAEPPPVVSTVAAAVAFVADDPGAIGYVPADAPTAGVRVVTVVP